MFLFIFLIKQYVILKKIIKFLDWHKSLRKFTLGLDFSEVRVIPPLSTLGELRNSRVLEALNAIDRFFDSGILSLKSLASNPERYVREEGTTYPRAITDSFEQTVREYVRRVPKADRNVRIAAPQRLSRGDVNVTFLSNT